MEANWTTDLGTITSITAYRQAHFNFEDPFFSNPINPPAQIESINRNIEDSDQISEELRLAFTALDGRLDGIGGLYYLTEQVNRIEILNQIFPAPAQTGIAWFPQDVDATSTAVFGEVGFHLLDRLELIAGARMTWESKDVNLAGLLIIGPGLPPPLAVPYNVSASEDWDAFTPRFVVEWTVTDEAMVYASAARGFKSGGYQGTAGTGASAATPYDPEYAWSYELGAKSQWFENKVRVNAAAFHVDYEDLQVSSLVPLCCVVIGNAADAEVDGFEIEITGRPLPGLELNSNHTWLNAEFTDFASGATANFSGNTLPRAPENKTNIGAQYTIAVSNDPRVVRPGRLHESIEDVFRSLEHAARSTAELRPLRRTRRVARAGRWLGVCAVGQEPDGRTGEDAHRRVCAVPTAAQYVPGAEDLRHDGELPLVGDAASGRTAARYRGSTKVDNHPLKGIDNRIGHQHRVVDAAFFGELERAIAASLERVDVAPDAEDSRQVVRQHFDDAVVRDRLDPTVATVPSRGRS